MPSFISTSLILTQFVTTKVQVHLNEFSVHESVALGPTVLLYATKRACMVALVYKPRCDL